MKNIQPKIAMYIRVSRDNTERKQQIFEECFRHHKNSLDNLERRWKHDARCYK